MTIITSISNLAQRPPTQNTLLCACISVRRVKFCRADLLRIRSSADYELTRARSLRRWPIGRLALVNRERNLHLRVLALC
jgi:hypothetical protein